MDKPYIPSLSKIRNFLIIILSLTAMIIMGIATPAQAETPPVDSPLTVTATAGNTLIAISWDNTLLPPTTTYTATATAGEQQQTCTTTDNHCTITSLTNDTPYVITVTASDENSNTTTAILEKQIIPGVCTITQQGLTLKVFQPTTITGDITCSGTVPPTGTITITNTSDQTPQTITTETTQTTDTTATYTTGDITPTVGGVGTLTTTLTNPDVGITGTTATPLTVDKANIKILPTLPKLRSERTSTILVSTSTAVTPKYGTLQPAQARQLKVVTVLTENTGDGTRQTRQIVTKTNVNGQTLIPVNIWKKAIIKITVVGNESVLPAATTFTVTSQANHISATIPVFAPQPKLKYPDRAKAQGFGANARISLIPLKTWNFMQNRTWNYHCVGKNSLRLINVNYWGFDGYRYRGEIIVRADTAQDVANIFTNLYNIGYPIRQMILPDKFGHNINGWPGANDYAQMSADNTSGFNCRYVVGLEYFHVLSPHASGRAIDINPWENPYAAPTGYFPNSWYMYSRSANNTGVLNKYSVGVFTSRGYFWGGWWSAADYQHFQR